MMNTPLPAPISTLLAAVDSLDTDAFLHAFDHDGFVDDWGRTFTGADAIRTWSDREFIGANVTLALTQVTTVDNRTEVAATVGGDGFNGPSHFVFVIAGDRVRSMSITA